MKHTKKTVARILAGTALALTATHASAIGYTGQLTFDRSADATFNGTTAVKNWADMGIDLGWMHTTKWFTLHVVNSGATSITLTDTSAAYSATTTSNNASTGNTTVTTNDFNGHTSNVAFSIWSFAGAAPAAGTINSGGNTKLLTDHAATHWDGTNTQTNNTMGYNQVAAPSSTNNSKFLAAGGVNGFVGYANSGDTFTNGNGDFVGHGSAGSAYGTDANGHKYASLTIAGLAAGDYLLAVGANCINLNNCGNESTLKHTVVTNTATGALVSDTTISNPTNTWGNANYHLSVAAVPVPGAVWLFGTAMAGMIGISRRKQALAA